MLRVMKALWIVKAKLNFVAVHKDLCRWCLRPTVLAKLLVAQGIGGHQQDAAGH